LGSTTSKPPQRRWLALPAGPIFRVDAWNFGAENWS